MSDCPYPTQLIATPALPAHTTQPTPNHCHQTARAAQRPTPDGANQHDQL